MQSPAHSARQLVDGSVAEPIIVAVLAVGGIAPLSSVVVQVTVMVTGAARSGDGGIQAQSDCQSRRRTGSPQVPLRGHQCRIPHRLRRVGCRFVQFPMCSVRGDAQRRRLVGDNRDLCRFNRL